MKPVICAGKKIGPEHPCFIIAEAGVNHNGSLDTALQLVEAASKAGADAVKFQLYNINEQVSLAAPVAEYQKAGTGMQSMLQMAESYELPWKQHEQIVARCRELGIAYMASCFDKNAVDFFIGLGGDCIKVGSGEITNYPLLEYMASTGKPILLSTGMCSLADVADAVQCIRNAGDSPLVLFQCVSNYPAAPSSINLKVLKVYSEAFNVLVGYSDHTEGNAVAAASVALGACMIEKHFTLAKSMPGPDHAMSLNPEELTAFVASIRDVQASIGDGIKRIVPSEETIRTVARRSLVATRDILPGETIDDGNVTLKRPASGIDPRAWQYVKGRRVSIKIVQNMPITWEALS
jgi:N,N'-diacetyllegionaminate synthase